MEDVEDNIDGALLQNNTIRIWIIFRDNLWKHIVAAGWSMLHWDNNKVELMSLHYIERIVKPWMLELNRVITEGDNIRLIKFMQNSKLHKDFKTWQLDCALFDYLKLFHDILFVHTNRRNNKVANFCARKTIDGHYCWKMEDSDTICIPQEIFYFLKEDFNLYYVSKFRHICI